MIINTILSVQIAFVHYNGCVWVKHPAGGFAAVLQGSMRTFWHVSGYKQKVCLRTEN